MARQKTLQCMYKSIDKEEMHLHVECEFESLRVGESYGEGGC